MAEFLPDGMDSNDKKVVHVKVVSPSLPPLTVSSIPVSTTIQELKVKISQTAPAHPPVGHQRLIYRGHPLLRGEQTIKELFTQQAINQNESITIHLVMPPVAPTQPVSSPPPLIHAPAPNSAQTHQSQIAPNGPPIVQVPQDVNGLLHVPQTPSGPINAGQSAMQQTQLPPHLHQIFNMPHNIQQQLAEQLAFLYHHPIMQGQVAQPNGQMHPANMPGGQQAHLLSQLQQTINLFHAIQQQMAGQLASLYHHPIMQGQVAQPNGQMHPTNMSGGQQASAPPHLPQQQQQQHPVLVGALPPGHGTHPQQHLHPDPTIQIHGQPPRNFGQFQGSPNTTTVVRDHIRPNGQRWSTVTQFGTMNVVNPIHAHQHPGIAPGASSARTATPTYQHPQPGLEPPGSTAPDTASSLPPGPSQPSSAHAPGPTPMTTNLSSEISDVLRTAQARAASQCESRGAEASAVYVLSSPSGPQALLVAPSGNYIAPWQVVRPPVLANYPYAGNAPPMPPGFMPNLGLQHANAFPHGPAPEYDQMANTQRAQHAIQIAQAQPQAPGAALPGGAAGMDNQQQQAQQARDLARVIIPLGGHLWLFIRLFGFVYFFTHGASWTRTLFLVAIATLVFIGQTGVFRPLVQGLWEPIRRHADNLIPLANYEQRRGDAGGAAQDNANAAGAQGRAREPVPQEAARRLLEQRQDESLVRQGLRRVERAIALFVASLVPGVGERHIAAREAAEAARQALVTEREEQQRRAEEEARQRQEETAAAAIDGAGANTPASDGDGKASASSPQGQADSAQPALIEV